MHLVKYSSVLKLDIILLKAKKKKKTADLINWMHAKTVYIQRDIISVA